MSDIKTVADKADILFNDLGGLRKKKKLDIPALKREQFDTLND